MATRRFRPRHRHRLRDASRTIVEGADGTVSVRPSMVNRDWRNLAVIQRCSGAHHALRVQQDAPSRAHVPGILAESFWESCYADRRAEDTGLASQLIGAGANCTAAA